MRKEQLIEIMMSFREEKPRAFWEAMSEDLLENLVKIEERRLEQQASDEVATLA
jgi:hypothetical protein